MGFSQKQSVAIAYVLTGILGLAAVLLTVSGAMKALIMLGAVFVVGAVGLKVILSEHRSKQEKDGAEKNGEEDENEPY